MAAGIYVVIFGVMWLPYYAAGVQGQLFLYPIFALIELVVLALAIVAVVLAIVGAVRRTTSARATVVVLIVALLLLVPGPMLLWFGTIPA